MVLHNDKWAKKAKRAVERRKGITKPHSQTQNRSDGPTVERLDMGRPEAAEAQASEVSASTSESDDDSFEFDSGDEGQFIKHSASTPTQTAAAVVQDKTPWRRGAVPPPGHSVVSARQAQTAENLDDEEEPQAKAKVDKRFARRKLLDNSSRYEESVLDPYLQPVGNRITLLILKCSTDERQKSRQTQRTMLNCQARHSQIPTRSSVCRI